MATEFKKVSLADIPTSLTDLYSVPSNCDTVVNPANVVMSD